MRKNTSLMLAFILVIMTLYFIFFLFIDMLNNNAIRITGAAVSVNNNEGFSLSLLLISLLIAVFVILVIQIRSTLRENQEVEIYPNIPSEVIDYIRKGLLLGAEERDIRIKLEEAGWPNEIIDNAFREVYGLRY